MQVRYPGEQPCAVGLADGGHQANQCHRPAADHHVKVTEPGRLQTGTPVPLLMTQQLTQHTVPGHDPPGRRRPGAAVPQAQGSRQRRRMQDQDRCGCSLRRHLDGQGTGWFRNVECPGEERDRVRRNLARGQVRAHIGGQLDRGSPAHQVSHGRISRLQPVPPFTRTPRDQQRPYPSAMATPVRGLPVPAAHRFQKRAQLSAGLGVVNHQQHTAGARSSGHLHRNGFPARPHQTA